MLPEILMLLCGVRGDHGICFGWFRRRWEVDAGCDGGRFIRAPEAPTRMKIPPSPGIHIWGWVNWIWTIAWTVDRVVY